MHAKKLASMHPKTPIYFVPLPTIMAFIALKQDKICL